MSSVTTESGQAREDLISMFEAAQQLASTERTRAREVRSVVRRAVSNSQAEEHGGHVDVHMPLTDWTALKRSATEEP